jgi:hypothetical protein
MEGYAIVRNLAIVCSRLGLHMRINLRELARSVRERLRDAESARGSCERAARVREACEKLRETCKGCGVGSSCKRFGMTHGIIISVKPIYELNYNFVSLA